MSKTNDKMPEIRFPGFTDPWEQRMLGECLDEITYGFTNPMSDTDNGPWKITAKDIVNGTIDFGSARHTSQEEYNALTNKSKPHTGDILLTKDGTLGRTAIVNVENICINQSVALLRCNDLHCSNKYIQVLLETPAYQKCMLDDAGGGTIKHIYITKVDQMAISIPSKQEQAKLVALVELITNSITLHQRMCDELKKHKKGMLQQMFPQPGEFSPRVRFPGFTDSWEQRKLEEIFTERHILSKITEEYPRLSFTIEEGVIHPEDRKTNKRDFLMKDESNKKFLVTEFEDIIYNPANVVWGALHRNTYGKGCLSPIYKIFSTDENPAFIECILRSPSFIRALSQKTEGTVVKLKTLKPEAFLEMSISVAPQRAEQDAIAAVFEQIDNLITLHQCKCDELKLFKKGLLQKMFV